MKRIRSRRLVAVPALLCSAWACNVGPNYSRPDVSTPATYRGATVAPVAAAGGAQAAATVADERWSVLFQDSALRNLLQLALANNYDVQSAANRVLSARARYGLVRADQYPTLAGHASAGAQRGRFSSPDPQTVGVFQLGAALSWEVDFWGKFRRASEAAQAEMLGSEWGRRAVSTTLVSEVATSYFQLRALDRQLEIAQRTLASRQESLRLTQIRDKGGAGSLVDVWQAEQLVDGARGEITRLTLTVTEEENAISVLIGQNPGPVARGLALGEQPHAPELPAGLPSALIERRPDIQRAEQALVSANAGIGVAKAAYFPQISLTASGGVASPALSTLFSVPSLVWSAAAGLVQPIFEAGRIDAQVTLAELERSQAVLDYRHTIQLAFREVSDALCGYQGSREYSAIQERLVHSANEARRLADMRYKGGATSYLEVLDSDTRLFVAELGFVQAQLNELSAFVEVYRALGGGWQA
jgi:outer membrane protein, multidrug efflux system